MHHVPSCWKFHCVVWEVCLLNGLWPLSKGNIAALLPSLGGYFIDEEQAQLQQTHMWWSLFFLLMLPLGKSPLPTLSLCGHPGNLHFLPTISIRGWACDPVRLPKYHTLPLPGTMTGPGTGMWPNPAYRCFWETAETPPPCVHVCVCVIFNIYVSNLPSLEWPHGKNGLQY